MRINYLLQVHQHPEQFARLVRLLTAPQTAFYVHVDLKQNLEPFKEIVSDLSNVHFLERRVEVRWGHFSQVQATLNGIKKILSDHKKGGGKAYVVLMSGSDYPLKRNQEIYDYLDANYGMNFIQSVPIEEYWDADEVNRRLNQYSWVVNPTNRKIQTIPPLRGLKSFTKHQKKSYEIIRKSNKKWQLLFAYGSRKFPSYLQPHGGSQWWALPIETLAFIRKFLERRPSYLRYNRFFRIPDESFFHSIISSRFAAEKIKDTVTYVNWEREPPDRPATFHTENDFEELRGLDYLFARKFAYPESKEILDQIDRELLD
jgi:hypothetical protein